MLHPSFQLPTKKRSTGKLRCGHSECISSAACQMIQFRISYIYDLSYTTITRNASVNQIVWSEGHHMEHINHDVVTFCAYIKTRTSTSSSHQLKLCHCQPCQTDLCHTTRNMRLHYLDVQCKQKVSQ